jgi:hypothetical protein
MLSRRFIDKTWPVCLLVLIQGLLAIKKGVHFIKMLIFILEGTNNSD